MVSWITTGLRSIVSLHLSGFSWNCSYKKLRAGRSCHILFCFFASFWALGWLAAICPVEGWCRNTGGFAGTQAELPGRDGCVSRNQLEQLLHGRLIFMMNYAVIPDLSVPANISNSKGIFFFFLKKKPDPLKVWWDLDKLDILIDLKFYAGFSVVFRGGS